MLTLMFMLNLFLYLILEEIFAVYPVSGTVSNCQYFCRYISQSPQSAHWTANMHFIYMISHSLCFSIFLYFNYSRHFYIFLHLKKFFSFKALCLYNDKRWRRTQTHFLHIIQRTLACEILNYFTSLPMTIKSEKFSVLMCGCRRVFKVGLSEDVSLNELEQDIDR